MSGKLAGRRIPYIGPVPFDAEHQEVFFGRARETAEVTYLTLASRVVVVCSPSGAGKTSLMNAGVIPALQRQGVAVLGPTGLKPAPTLSRSLHNDNEFIATLLAEWTAPSPDGLPIWPESLHDVLAATRPSPRVIVLDQFEDVFTTDRERQPDREDLFQQLSQALDEFRELRLVILLREEFLAAFDALASLLPNGARDRFHLGLLSREAAIEAVLGPAEVQRRRAGHPGPVFEDGVAERLVHDLTGAPIDDVRTAAGDVVDPLTLQVACRQLWRARPAGVERIGLRHLERLGSVADVLPAFYNDVINRAADADVDAVSLRAWVQAVLITDIGTRSMGCCIRDTVATLPVRVVKVLEEEHLVRAEWRAGLRWYELAHDRLIPVIVRANNRGADSRRTDDFQQHRSRASRLLARANEQLAVMDLDGAEFGLAKAITQFQRIEDVGHEAACWLTCGAVALCRGELDRADSCYRRSSQLLRGTCSANESAAHAGLGLLERERGQLERATAELRTAIEIDADNWSAYKTLGDVSAENGDLATAVDAYRRALALDPDGAEVVSGWCDLLLRMNDEAAARTAVTELGRRAPADPAAVVAAALFHEQVAEFDRARDLAQRAVRFDVTPRAYRLLIDVELRTRRYDVALRHAERAVETADQDPWLQQLHGQALLATGRYVEALARYDRIIAMRPGDAWSHYCRGLARAHGRDQQASRTDLMIAIGRTERQYRERPGLLELSYNLSLCHFAAGRSDRAVDLIRDLDHAPRPSLLKLLADLRWLIDCWPPLTPGREVATKVCARVASQARVEARPAADDA